MEHLVGDWYLSGAGAEIYDCPHILLTEPRSNFLNSLQVHDRRRHFVYQFLKFLYSKGIVPDCLIPVIEDSRSLSFLPHDKVAGFRSEDDRYSFSQFVAEMFLCSHAIAVKGLKISFECGIPANNSYEFLVESLYMQMALLPEMHLSESAPDGTLQRNPHKNWVIWAYAGDLFPWLW